MLLECSNNAMGLWSKIKGKGTEFKGPQPVGQVLSLAFFYGSYPLVCFMGSFDHGRSRFCTRLTASNDCSFHGQAIMKNLPPSEMIESCSVAGPGFVNVVLSKNWMAKVFFSPQRSS